MVVIYKRMLVTHACWKDTKDQGIRKTDLLIVEVRNHEQRIAFAQHTSLAICILEKIATTVDLMRKPEIKEIKAALFMEAVLRSLQDLGREDPDQLRQQLAQMIREKGLPRAVPTTKEICSDVCWAKVCPIVVEL